MSDVNQQGITFSKNDVEIIARETLYRGFFFARFISFSPSPV